MLDFVRPTAGSADVLGLDSQRESLAIRRRTGVLPDAYQVCDRLTGRQHVQFAIDSKDTDDDPDALLERVDLAEAADRKAGGVLSGSLSSGGPWYLSQGFSLVILVAWAVVPAVVGYRRYERADL